MICSKQRCTVPSRASCSATARQGRAVEVVLKKMGNSVALVMPPAVLRGLGVGVGQRFSLSTTAGGTIVLTPKRKYVLAELIRQCDLKAPPPADMGLWDVARPVGQEVL